ncbi:ABC transporter ATP-binding protein [Clavibacter tessellarius]|uniref:ABC transporter domain-containing protein n=1 Tax=Clavibacter tessellarius TaxID=31965 RepID=A0A154V564_9MICO|nr:ABC transporter ATP-binding protein [Clavibacter michiganensis]KZC96505.1 hypothetical protein AWH51_02050 [Clavibacter michiganensis subsp. tessellarius]
MTDARGPVVALDGVGVAFRSREVLRDVTCRIGAGERILVIGPSGSGKSTLLHVVTGVVPHSVHATMTGSATVAGLVDAPVLDRVRHVGFVAQDPSAAVVLPTVEQDVALVLENHGVDPAEVDARIDEALEAVGAGHLRHRETDRLSGGEAQRVAIAAALAARPALLVLDEPTAMLDAAGVRAVRDAIARLPAEVAVLMVEHRLDALGPEGLPARTIALDPAGRLLADGPTHEVLREHAAALAESGCWVPGWAADAHTPVPRASAAPAAEPVLRAVGLAVHPAAVRPRRFRRAPDPLPPVLAGVDLALRPGELVALIGANGSGKSTLLRTLAGLVPPVAGSVAGARPGMVFQDPAHQFVAASVRDEIAVGLADDDPRIDDALRCHRLEHVRDASPHRLSGGEKRRLSLAAMLVHDRPVLLADEPTFGLDRRDAEAAMGALVDASRTRAVVFSSHDLALVGRHATRAVVLGRGTVIHDGGVDALVASPALLVAGGIA